MRHGPAVRACAAGAALAVALLVGCAADGGAEKSAPMRITLVGFNDFHGNLEPPKVAISVPADTGATQVPAGGAAYFASAVQAIKARSPHHAVISAGDMIGASPLVSSLFLDEPTVEAMNLIGVDFHAAGNHEFDRGWRELLRMREGGCEQFTAREPCQLSKPYRGAQFEFLAANTFQPDGRTLLPATALKRFTENGATVTVGFIGMTLRTTPTMVDATGVAGLRFDDEAETANALIPQLRAQGADVIVLVVHEGGQTTAGITQPGCEGLSGGIVPILQRLSPQVDVVISGHTHQAYICDYAQVDPQRPLLLTSAGLYGTLLTEIRLDVDTRSRKVVGKQAQQVIVQGEAFMSTQGEVPLHKGFPQFAAQPDVAQLVATYGHAAQALGDRAVGWLAAPVMREPVASGESALGNLIADAQLAAARLPERGGAQISFMNRGGVRADLVPDAQGVVRYGQLYAVQPFGNTLEVRSYTGAQLQAVLEQQFNSGTNTVASPRIMSVSEGFSYRYDLRQEPGQRVTNLTLHGVPVAATDVLRVALSSYMTGGGDNYSVWTQGTDTVGAGLDLDVFVAYFRSASPVAVAGTDRIQRVSP
jgi:5'-nucleotidase